LLGERYNDVVQPFVITVEQLERGIKRSKFGTTRSFRVGTSKFTIKVEGSRLGKGVGDCGTCPNIQELTVTLSLRTAKVKPARFGKV